MNDVESIIETIKETAAENNQYLHRYQTNRGNHSVVVTYCLDSHEDKPIMSNMCDGPRVVMGQLEGKTKRCEAYKKLSSLLDQIKQDE